MTYFTMGFGLLLLVVVLLLLAWGGRRAPGGIVLPQAQGDSAGVEDGGAESRLNVVVITPETVRPAINTLSRPASYSRVQRVETFWSGGSGQSVTQIHVSGGRTRLDTQLSDGSVRHMLVVGGAAGVLMVYALSLAGVLYVELARYTLSALLLIPIIQLCLVVKKPGSAAMACIVFLCVTVNYSPEDTPVLYAIERLFETLVGVALACGVDILLPYRTPPAPEEGPAAEADRPPEDAP